MCRQFRLFRVKRLFEMVLPDAGHRSKDHSTLGTRAASRHMGNTAVKGPEVDFTNGRKWELFLCTLYFLHLILSCNAEFIHCVNYYACLVDPDKLMMSNVYTVFFICDVYLSKVSSNEAKTADLFVSTYINAVQSMSYI